MAKKPASKPAAKKSAPKREPIAAKRKPISAKREPIAAKREPIAAARPAPDTGRYDIAGRYLGAGSPVSLPDGRGMSAQMAARVAADPERFKGYADPAKGTSRYPY